MDERAQAQDGWSEEWGVSVIPHAGWFGTLRKVCSGRTKLMVAALGLVGVAVAGLLLSPPCRELRPQGMEVHEVDLQRAAAKTLLQRRLSPDNVDGTVDLFLDGDSVEENLAAVDEALASASRPVRRVMIVACWRCPFGDEGARHVAEWHSKLGYRELSLKATGITPGGLAAILESGVGADLVKLELQENMLGTRGAELLAARTDLGGLKELNLGRNYIHPAGATALAEARSLDGLRRLELEYNFVGADGLRALSKSQSFPGLRDLGLAYNYIGDEGVERVVVGRAFPALAVLDVRGNELSEASVARLAATPNLATTQIWATSNNFDGEKLATTLAAPNLLPKAPLSSRTRPHLFDMRDNFVKPVEATEAAATDPPEGLPEAIDYREFWIWEFGLVAEFPTFLTPESRPGNGKGIRMSYLEETNLYIGGYWANDRGFDELVRPRYLVAGRGETISVTRIDDHTVLVRSVGPEQTRMSWVRLDGALLSVDFTYPTAQEAYFGPIADRVVRSPSFERD